jgi:membrane associated rhomboid family serine protease
MRYREHNWSPVAAQGNLTPAIKWLLVANGAIYLLGLLTNTKVLFDLFGLVPTAILGKGYLWQVATYMFLHGGFFHLFFNMFSLWMFGTDLEREWGTKAFLKFYFITGVGAGIITFLLTIGSSIPTIGASGAIYGILVAFAIIYPNRLVYIYFLFPVKVKYLVLFLIAMGVLASFTSSNPGIAHFTHLAGALIAFLYLKTDWRLSSLLRPIRRYNYERQLKARMKENRRKAELMDEVDQILDRITQLGGYENLPDKDKRTLENAAKHLSNHKD